MPLSADDIRRALEELSRELERDKQRAEIVIVGGAALVLLFGARQTTKDVDAYFVKPDASVIRQAAERVSERLELPADWLNDGAKSYIVSLTTGEVLYQSAALVVRAASTPQLLGMKLAAWRDAVDRADAKLLLTQMAGSRDEIWRAVEPFIQRHQLQKAFYAFEDLWDASNEP